MFVFFLQFFGFNNITGPSANNSHHHAYHYLTTTKLNQWTTDDDREQWWGRPLHQRKQKAAVSSSSPPPDNMGERDLSRRQAPILLHSFWGLSSLPSLWIWYGLLLGNSGRELEALRAFTQSLTATILRLALLILALASYIVTISIRCLFHLLSSLI